MRYHEIINEIKMSSSRLQSRVGKLDAKIGIEYEFVYEEKDLEKILSTTSPKTYREIYRSFLDTYDFKRTLFYTFKQMKEKENPDISFDEVYDSWEDISETDITPILKELGINTYKDIITKYKMEIKNNILIDILEMKFNKAVNPVNPYEIKTDASVKDNDGSVLTGNKIGAEIVSPPQDFEQTIIDLENMRKFIKENGYTNDTTGLHINVSLPGFDRDKLDYIKMVLLVGDRYVLSQFQRQFTIYAKSSMGKIRHGIKTGYTDLAYVLDSFKGNLNQNAGKLAYIDVNEKELSMGLKPDRIEFRSPGGNWTETITEEFMKQTVMRFVVALDAALDPSKYQQEYAKKLYKLFSDTLKSDNGDVSKLFSEYFAKNITREQLQSRLKNIRRDRKKFKDFLDTIDLDELPEPPKEIRVDK